MGTLECTSGRELLTVVDAFNLTIVYGTSRDVTRPGLGEYFSERERGLGGSGAILALDGVPKNLVAFARVHGHRAMLGIDDPYLACAFGEIERELAVDFFIGRENSTAIMGEPRITFRRGAGRAN